MINGCADSTECSEPDFSFIVEPLREVLSWCEPISEILQILDVLKVRFQRQCSDIDNWNRTFDITTPFFMQLRDPTTLAFSTTQRDMENFRLLRFTVSRRD